MAGSNHQTLIKVVDASAILGRILPDEVLDAELKRVFSDFAKEKCDFIAPELLKIEVANALKSAVRQARMTPDQATTILTHFLAWPITYKTVNIADCFQNSLQYGLSVYDAQYLTLAQQEGVGLLTLDKKLKGAVTSD